MKEKLSHLPEHKQAELQAVTDAILDKVPDVKMIVLFGSYARGNWVEDTHIEDNITHVYESDFDILVATKTKKTAEDSTIHDKVEKAIDAAGTVKTPCSIIYHSLGYVKQMITEGHYFFADIKKEGIHLYRKDSKASLGKVKILTPAERRKLAQEYFDQWFEKANGAYRGYERYLEDNDYKWAAFMLHQATEAFYSAVTLVFINYRFRTHDIKLLAIKAAGYDSRFAEVFPQETQEQKDLFNLLKRAYIDARYKDSYQITEDQLRYLAERVELLQNLTEKICKEKINSFI